MVSRGHRTLKDGGTGADASCVSAPGARSASGAAVVRSGVLNGDQQELAIGRNQDLVLPCADAQEGDVVLRVDWRLGDADWLDGPFGVGDLMMVTVLRRPAGASLLGDYPNLAAYVERAEARPAFQRAFAAQLAVFEASSKS